MNEELFNLVFSGDLVKGSQEEAVKANLVRLFKLAPEQVDKMFSGKVITIKKNVDAETGRKLRAKFKQAGAVCRLESFSTTSVSSEPSSNASQSKESTKTSPSATSPSVSSPSVSSPAVFKIPDDPVEVEPPAEPDSSNPETKGGMETDSGEEPASPSVSSPAVFNIPDDPTEEAPVESDSVSSDSKDSLETQQIEEPASETETGINNDSPVSETSDVLADAVEEVPEDSSSNANTETPSNGLTIAPTGADVLEGYSPPEPPPPPNVDGMTIAPAGTDLLEVKKVVKPVEVDISGISLVKEDA